MTERWRFKLFKIRMATILASLLVFHQSLSLCCSLNAEGIALLKFRDRVVRDPFGALSNWNVHDGDVDHCFWFGVECSDGKVISLKLKDLCLEGTLTPELGKLIYIKSIILRNNSFSRNIPVEVAELKELEVLDLGYNNFSEPFPSDIGSNLSLSIILLDNNENQLASATVGASCNSRSSGWHPPRGEDVAQRRLLLLLNPFTIIKAKRNKFLPPLPSPSPSSSPSPVQSIVSPSHSPSSSFPIPPPSKLLLPDFPSASPSHSFTPSPSPMPPPSAVPPALSNLPIDSKPPAYHPSPLASPGSAPSQSEQQNSKSANNTVTMWFGVTGGSLVLLFSVVCIIFCRSSKMVTVGPWVTGLSGQLQKAFVTGVPKLQRSELLSACEDFSNIIGSLSDGTVYKGTLSSGVEIAVASTAVKSAEDWSKKLEGQFRKKIETLSKVSHKNFVNLIGFCEEGQPFTRMMVFEYTPNGTLFEHLHIMEAEHLEWTTRLRIAMGVAYCLEHMHQLKPPIAHANLHSSSIYLTEDYAAKISDFRFWNETTATIMGSIPTKLLETPASDRESNVYSFGIILFEIVTGKIPYSTGNDSLVDWVCYYLKGDRPIKEMVDPTLTSFQEDVLEKVFAVIKDCVHLEPRQRPTMKEVTGRLKEITAMGPDGATPKTSPLWWAELEIMSSEVSS